MLSMTQTQSKMDGKTVLFVPQDAVLGDPEEGPVWFDRMSMLLSASVNMYDRPSVRSTG